MELQKKILLQYISLYDGPKLRVISENTGIQLTRVFRILNGSPMKIDEYEIFKKRVMEKSGIEGILENLTHECTMKLSQNVLIEIEEFLKRKIYLWEMKQGIINTKSNLLAQ